jgi:hypothetical protein
VSSFVTLNPTEIKVAEVVGTARARISRTNGFRDCSHVSNEERLKKDVDAAGAEIAASKATGCRWNMTTGENLDEPDLHPSVEVRHTTHDQGGLIFRPRDEPKRIFVLVIGTLPNYIVVGWARGADVRRDEHRWQDCWRMPQSRLTRFQGES